MQISKPVRICCINFSNFCTPATSEPKTEVRQILDQPVYSDSGSDSEDEIVDKTAISDDHPDYEQFDFVPDSKKTIELMHVPVLFLINPRSGAGKGQICINILEKMTNVFVLSLLDFATSDTSMADKRLVELLETEPLKDVRLVAGGGDGTVGWIFAILDRIKMSPPVAVLPLGTGNEFSGCVGWSHKVSTKKLGDFVAAVRDGKEIGVDVWRVKFKDSEISRENSPRTPKLQSPSDEGSSNRPSDSLSLSNDEKYEEEEDNEASAAFLGHRPEYMVAFMSWGHDADISHKFHLERENRKRQPSRFALKLTYIKLGVKEMINPGPRLNNLIQFTVDDKQVDLNSARSCRCFQVLNINRMAEQIDFFGQGELSNKDDLLLEGDYKSPLVGDGLFELVGTKTLHHMNLMRLKMTHAIRLAQGNKLIVNISEPTPMLIDGEAWVNPPGEILIAYSGLKHFILGPKENTSVKQGVMKLPHSL